MRSFFARVSWWKVMVILVGLTLVGMFVVAGLIANRIGWKVSGYVISQIYREVVYRDGSLTKFQKKVDTDGKEQYKEDTYEVPGFISLRSR